MSRVVESYHFRSCLVESRRSYNYFLVPAQPIKVVRVSYLVQSCLVASHPISLSLVMIQSIQ